MRGSRPVSYIFSVYLANEVAAMLGEAIKGPQHTQVEYICVAADLLQGMMSELQCLAANNTSLTLAVEAAGHDLRPGLHALRGTVELLRVSRDAVRSIELTEQAKALIIRLASDLQRLALQTERDYAQFVPTTYGAAISSLLE
jgi:hypothetical protein